MTPIDTLTHMAVSLESYAEIPGAEAADLLTSEVLVREVTYSGEVCRTIHVPAGVRIVRRR